MPLSARLPFAIALHSRGSRYFVRVTIARRIAPIVHEKEIWVYSYKMPPEIQDSIRMEVGLEDCLHIEFEYDKAKYALDQCPLKL